MNQKCRALSVVALESGERADPTRHNEGWRGLQIEKVPLGQLSIYAQHRPGNRLADFHLR